MKKLLIFFLFCPFVGNIMAFTEAKMDVNINSKVFVDYVNNNNLAVKEACADDICVLFGDNIQEDLERLANKYYSYIKNKTSEEDYLSLYYKGFVIDRLVLNNE